MKSVPILAGVIAAALGAIAFIAAAPASATVLCQTVPKVEKSELVCGKPYGPGPVYLTLKSGTKINFLGYGTKKAAEEAEGKELSEAEEAAAAMFTCNEGRYVNSLEKSNAEVSSVTFKTSGGKCNSETFGAASVSYNARNLDYQSGFLYLGTAAPQGQYEIDELTKTAKMAFELFLPGEETCKYEALTRAVGDVTNGSGVNPTTIKLDGGLFMRVKGSEACKTFVFTTATFVLQSSELANLYIAKQ
jgi:hypothetical protein